MSDGRVQFAQTLRGVAALCVVVFHYCIGYWQPIARNDVATLINGTPLPVSASIPDLLLPLQTVPLFNLGQLGVSLFFLISGFVIPFSIRRESVGGFALSRLFRILPVYVAGFSLTLLVVLASGSYFGRPWLLRPDEVLIHYLPGLRDLLHSRNIDGIVWTLEIEVKFYLLCALLAPLFRNLSLWVFAAPAVLLAVTLPLDIVNVSVPILSTTAPYLVLMFIGVAIHYLHAGRITTRRATAIGFGLFVAYVALTALAPFELNPLAGISYGAALLLFIVAYAFPAAFRGNRVTEFFADISYPLYVVHAVAGFAILRIGADLGMPPYLTLPTAFAVAIGTAWIIHLVVEVPTQRWSKGSAGAFATLPRAPSAPIAPYPQP